MNIKIKKTDVDYQKLLLYKDYSMDVATIYNEFFENFIDKISIYKNSKKPYSKKILELERIDIEDPYIKDLIKETEFNDIILLDNAKYLNNPYYKNIKIKNLKNKNLTLEYDTIKSNEAFIYKPIKTNENNYYIEINHLGYFNEDFKYIALKENDITWMSITPHEIESMKKDIDFATGNVLQVGLGLGYFTYMVSLKEDVKSITVIENNQDIIDLFTKNILSQFKYKNKITIINIDAIKHFNKMKTSYDYIFIDTYHNAVDGLEMYLRSKHLEKETLFSFWIEEEILALLRRYMISLIEEEINGSKDEDYKKIDSFDDHLISDLHFYLKDYEVNSYQSIKDLLSDNNLKKIAKNLKNY